MRERGEPIPPGPFRQADPPQALTRVRTQGARAFPFCTELTILYRQETFLEAPQTNATELQGNWQLTRFPFLYK